MGKKLPSTPVEQSALIALQEELDAERVAHVKTRQRLEREIETLHARLAELDAELAAVAARVREIEAQRARGR